MDGLPNMKLLINKLINTGQTSGLSCALQFHSNMRVFLNCFGEKERLLGGQLFFNSVITEINLICGQNEM